jgi:hypothetical protein
MKLLDRLLLLVVAVVALAAVAPAITVLAVTGTACLAAIELVRYFTRR